MTTTEDYRLLAIAARTALAVYYRVPLKMVWDNAGGRGRGIHALREELPLHYQRDAPGPGVHETKGLLLLAGPTAEAVARKMTFDRLPHLQPELDQARDACAAACGSYFQGERLFNRLTHEVCLAMRKPPLSGAITRIAHDLRTYGKVMPQEARAYVWGRPRPAWSKVRTTAVEEPEVSLFDDSGSRLPGIVVLRSGEGQCGPQS